MFEQMLTAIFVFPQSSALCLVFYCSFLSQCPRYLLILDRGLFKHILPSFYTSFFYSNWEQISVLMNEVVTIIKCVLIQTAFVLYTRQAILGLFGSVWNRFCNLVYIWIKSLQLMCLKAESLRHIIPENQRWWLDRHSIASFLDAKQQVWALIRGSEKSFRGGEPL